MRLSICGLDFFTEWHARRYGGPFIWTCPCPLTSQPDHAMSAKGESNPPRQCHRFWSMATKWPPTPHVRLKVRLRAGHDLRPRNPSCTWQAGKRSTHAMRPRRKHRVRHVPWSRVPCSWYIVPRCTKHVFRETCAPMPVVAPVLWWREWDSNPRPLAHEASELPNCSIPRWRKVRESNSRADSHRPAVFRTVPRANRGYLPMADAVGIAPTHDLRRVRLSRALHYCSATHPMVAPRGVEPRLQP